MNFNKGVLFLSVFPVSGNSGDQHPDWQRTGQVLAAIKQSPNQFRYCFESVPCYVQTPNLTQSLLFQPDLSWQGLLGREDTPTSEFSECWELWGLPKIYAAFNQYFPPGFGTAQADLGWELAMWIEGVLLFLHS